MIININEYELNKEFSFNQILNISDSYNLTNNNIDIYIKGTISNEKNYYLFSGKIISILKKVCDNCLEPAEIKIEVIVAEKFSEKTQLQQDDEVFAIVNKNIDLNEIILLNLYSNIPSRITCSENCKGLCVKCGKNLNNVDCGCDTKVVDPRFDSLVSLIANKEV